jgi:sec-independent protein translocase protein TatC
MPDLAIEPEEQKEIEQELRRTGSMSLLQHLQELRSSIIHSLAAVGICFLALWYYADLILDYMIRPIKQALAANHLPAVINYTSPTDPFNIKLKLGFIAGLFVACPYVLYQVWRFIAPGLYRHEKRFILPFLFLSVGLFLGGGFFGYRVVFPVALEFLIQQGQQMQAMITIDKYSSLFLSIIGGLAVIFEMPIVLGFAGMMGVVNAKFLFKHIRGAVLICVTAAAILSPTTDIMNLAIYSAPMVLLYILSIGVVWLVHPKQRRKRREKREQQGLQ